MPFEIQLLNRRSSELEEIFLHPNVLVDTVSEWRARSVFGPPLFKRFERTCSLFCLCFSLGVRIRPELLFNSFNFK